jgi:hypothetical protein
MEALFLVANQSGNPMVDVVGIHLVKHIGEFCILFW